MLTGLAPHEATLLVEQVAGGNALSPATVAQIVARSDGIPLFIEELAASLRDAAQHDAVPVSLRSLFDQKLDALGKAREIAQAASVIGREFTLDALRAIVAVDAAALTNAEQGLIQSGFAVRTRRSGRDVFAFRHALMQDAAYANLVRKDRRTLHLRLAESLAGNAGLIEAAHPEVIAGHFAAGGAIDRAVDYYLLASRLATGRSALTEATGHLSKAADQLAALPKGQHTSRLELVVQMALARVHHDRLGSGSSEARAAFERAYELAREFGETEDMLQALDGLMNFHFSNSELERVIEYADQTARLGATRPDSGASLIARRSRGYAVLVLGRFKDAHDDLQEAMRLYARGHSVALRDPKVSVLAALAICLTVMGRIDDGHAASAEALRHAEALNKPNTTILGLRRVAVQKLVAHDFSALEAVAERLMVMSGRFETFAGMQEGEAVQSLALLRHGYDENIAARLLRALRLLHAGRHWSMLPLLLISGAGMCHAAGDTAGASWQLELSQDLVERSPGHWCAAELLRLRAAMCHDDTEAERLLTSAIAIARRQGAALWALRAHLDLARLSQRRGSSTVAIDGLTSALDGIKASPTTADVMAARQALTEFRTGWH